MPSSRTLILKGILGVAGLGVSSAGGIGLGLGKTFTEGQKEQASSSSNDEPVNDPQGLNIEVDEDADLGFPEECDTSCSLTAEQLKNLKFEQKGDAAIEFKDLKDGDEFELTIEKSEDRTNYPKGKKYILKPKTISEQVTIKNIKEGDIVFESGKEVLIRETEEGGKLEHLLEEVNELGIPKRCFGEQATKTCELTKEQLKKLKFEERGDERITVEGQNEGNIVTLKVEDKGDDLINYPRGKKYTLRSNGYVTIEGVSVWDIVLGEGEEVVIREKKEGGKLELLLDEIDRLGIPKKCEADEVTSETPKTCYLIQKQLKDLRFETKAPESQISVEGWSDISRFKLTIEDRKGDTENYPRGKKYRLEAITGHAKIKGLKDGEITVWDGKEIVIREASEGNKLEIAPEEVDDLGIPRRCKRSCQLTEQQLKKLKFEKGDEGEITVEGINVGKTVNLTVEDKPDDRENYPEGKKYTLRARNGTVTIKGLKDGNIVIGRKEFVIREKQGERKLEKAPEEVNNLGIPKRCEDGQTCELTKEQLEKLKFETSGGSSITVTGLGDDGKVDLKVETPSDVTDYPKGKKYILTSKSETTVTIQNVKDGNIEIGSKGVAIREKKTGDKLEKAPNEFNELGIPRRCKVEEVLKTSDTRSCELTQEELKKLKFGNFDGETDDVEVTGLKGAKKINLTISWENDSNNYPDNKKYSFDNTSGSEDIKIIKGGDSSQTVTIAKKKESWFKNDNGQLVLVVAKDKSQIAKEKKIKEVNEILEKLGFKRSSTLSISFTGDDSNPTRHGETKVVGFSKANNNADDLKKIRFQALGGGAAIVDDLYSNEIKVYLDWDDKYPHNMKFSFENQGFSAGFYFRNGSKNVKIEQRTKTMPTFKVVNNQLVKVS